MAIAIWVVVLVAGYCATASGGGFFFGRETLHPQVRHQCGHTRYPGLCVETLMGSSGVVAPQEREDILSALVNKTIVETKLSSTSHFTIRPRQQQLFTENQQQVHDRAKAVSAYCEELMSMSLKQLEQSLEALKRSPVKNKHDIQTWLSAALTLTETCKDSVHGLGRDLPYGLAAQISGKMDHLSRLSSNSLSLVNRIVQDRRNTMESKDYTESQSQDFPSWVSRKDRKLLESTGITANAVVAKDGSGDYKTVSEAINAASGGRFIIHVKSGVYKEKIRTNKDGITLIGDGKYSTIIENDDSVGAGGTSLSGSATFTIHGSGFMARDIGFQNNAGPGADQAIALTVYSDRSVFYRCSIAGYQDTLYALALRQFYRECDIYGTVDFIFGNAAAVFQSCELILRRPGGKSYNVILANGRSDPGQNTGFSVQNCVIGRDADYTGSTPSYLGRPWKEYSRSVVMESTIDKAITSQGWIQWPGYGSSVLKTLYFAEYANEGPGAGTSGRVKWPGFHVLDSADAGKFTVGSFLSGKSWLPSTGVTFVSGLH